LRIYFRNQPISNNNCLWWTCLLTDDCSFSPDPLANMVDTGNSCCWLVDSQQIFYSETLGQMNRNVVGSIYGRPSIKITFHSCYLSSFGSFGQAVSEEKIVYESTNQQHELPVLAMFVNRSKFSNLYRGPSIDATYHVSFTMCCMLL
jgi:hypothetical protein